MDRDLLLDLITHIYDVALDPVGWPEVLRQLATGLDGRAPTLYTHQLGVGQGAVSSALDIDEDHQKSYREYYAARNVLLLRGGDLMVEGRVRSSAMMCDDADFVRSEFYNDFMRPLDLRSGLGVTILRDGPRTFNLSLFRAHGRPAPDARDIAKLSALVPHLNRALRVHRYVAGLDLKNAAFEAAFDRSHAAVLLVDNEARILFANAQASELLREDRGLGSDRGRLQASLAADTTALRKRIFDLARPIERVAAEGPPVLRLARRAPASPLWVVAIPARPRDNVFGLREPSVVLFVHDPDRQRVPDEALLTAAFRFTAAEARLAALLAQGLTLEEAAEQLGTRLTTVRTQLRAIFDKTGVRRQSDLQRLLHQGPFGRRL